MAELRFAPEARAEAVIASIYLEEARIGYGEKFEQELDRVCERIAAYPRSGSTLPGYPPELDVRSYRMKTFRYSVIVAQVDQNPLVCAVAHHNREPGYWRDRLR